MLLLIPLIKEFLIYMILASNNYFHLHGRFCHLVFIYLIVISNIYSQAQSKRNTEVNKFEIDFLSKILDQVAPEKKFLQKMQSPLDSFEVFQKINETQLVWVSFWQYQNYRYPLFVQTNKEEIEDFYLAFPSFMLHDKIHQHLIAIWGQQQFYERAIFSAIYSWKNINNGKFAAVYEANCSITCFPVSLSMQKIKTSSGITPLWQQFHRQGIPKNQLKTKK